MQSWSELHKYAASGEYDPIKIQKLSSGLNKKSVYGSSVLHFSILGGNIDTITYILNNSELINETNFFGESCLHWACKEGTPEIVDLLINYGADLNVIDSDGNTPIMWA